MSTGFMHASSAPTADHGNVVWTHEVKEDDVVTFRVGRSGPSRLVAEWPGLATLACERDGTRETLTPARDGSSDAIEKLRRGYVRALLRDLRAQLGVHASAVEVNGGAVMFLGMSGSGKSTAAAEMCLRHGGALLADDVVLTEFDGGRVRVLPSEIGHWLDRESCAAIGVAPPRAEPARAKYELGAPRIASSSCPLVLVVVMRFDPAASAATFRRLRGTRAVRALLEATIRFDVEDMPARRRELEQITAVYDSAPFFELVRPRRQPGGAAAFVLGELGDTGR